MTRNTLDNESRVVQQLVADAGEDLIARLSWRRRNSLVVNPFLTTPNVLVRRKNRQIFAVTAHSAGRIEPAPASCTRINDSRH